MELPNPYEKVVIRYRDTPNAKLKVKFAYYSPVFNHFYLCPTNDTIESNFSPRTFCGIKIAIDKVESWAYPKK